MNGVTNKLNFQTGRVMTEGDELYYEIRGHGQPLMMVPGGGGNGRAYSFVADILSDEYKVITYDRRGNARSTRNDPQNFEISQQSRDAVAVLRVADETSAFIFGNSSGAVIALDMAKTQPQAVRAIIAHEPPLARIHPHSRKWQRFFARIYGTAFTFGSPVAMLRFLFGVGLPLGGSARSEAAEKRQRERRDHQIGMREMAEYFVKQELLPVTNYMPDIATIKDNRVKVFLAAGKEFLDKKRFYAQTAPILAKRMDCEMVIFPGHHVSYVDRPAEWTAVLRDVLHKVEGMDK